MTAQVAPIRAGLFVSDERGVRLVTGRCDGCARPHFPRTDSCPYCGGAVSERLAGPDGVVALSTVVSRQPPGYAGPVPYGFGIVRIGDDGLEIVSRIAADDPATITPGTPVRLALEEVPAPDGATATVWTFRAAAP